MNPHGVSGARLQAGDSSNQDLCVAEFTENPAPTREVRQDQKVSILQISMSSGLVRVHAGSPDEAEIQWGLACLLPLREIVEVNLSVLFERVRLSETGKATNRIH